MNELEESMMELNAEVLPPPVYTNTSTIVSTDQCHRSTYDHEDSGTEEGAMDHLDQTMVTHNEQF
jgi:hypothetical protein